MISEASVNQTLPQDPFLEQAPRGESKMPKIRRYELEIAYNTFDLHFVKRVQAIKRSFPDGHAKRLIVYGGYSNDGSEFSHGEYEKAWKTRTQVLKTSKLTQNFSITEGNWNFLTDQELKYLTDKVKKLSSLKALGFSSPEKQVLIKY